MFVNADADADASKVSTAAASRDPGFPRTQDLYGPGRRIIIRTEQCGGRRCFRGLRIRARDVLERLAAGAFARLILESFAALPLGISYTRGMKTAISLPDAVFHAAERQAKRAQKSRSQLYAEALAEYLDRHAPDEVTEAMNQVVDQLSDAPDPFVRAAAQSVLARVEW